MNAQTTEMNKEKLLADFNTVVTETEELLKSVAGAGSEKAGQVRASVEHNIELARQRLVALQHAATQTTMAAAHATDQYVHTSPWQAVGIAAGVGGVLGVIIGMSLSRR